MASVEKDKQVAPPAPRMKIDEFCAELSQSDRRVEMIGAFNSAERAAGRNNDTAEAFAGRFSKFCRQPA